MSLHPTQPTVSITTRGFANRYGIHPLIAFFTLCCDTMIFGLEVGSAGLSLPLSLIVSSAVGYATYKGQMAWYDDSPDSAKTKAIVLGVLTFIPSQIGRAHV